MIHYTLLPEGEIKNLKKEYHSRIFIILMFFISCSIVAGIVFLFPSYIISSIQGKDLNNLLESIKKDAQVRGADITVNNLRQTNEILQKMLREDNTSSFSSTIKKFVEIRPYSIKFTSFQLMNVANDKDVLEIIIQGRALTRE